MKRLLKLICMTLLFVTLICMVGCGSFVLSNGGKTVYPFVLVIDDGVCELTENTTLIDYMTALKQKDLIDFKYESNAFTSVGQVDNMGDNKWVVYTDDESYTTIDENAFTMGKKKLGIIVQNFENVIVKNGATYLFKYNIAKSGSVGGAIAAGQKLLEIKNSFNGENVNFEMVGKQIDEALAYTTLITKKMVNDIMFTAIDTMGANQGEFDTYIQKIKDKFTENENNDNFKYRFELKAVGILVDGFSSMSGEVDYKSLGETMDQAVDCGAVIISKQFVIEVMNEFVDEKMAGENEQLKNCVESIKNNFELNKENENLKFETEFTCLGKLVALVDDANGEIDYAKYGKTIDQTLALKPLTINKNVINDMIVSLMDNFTGEGEKGQFNSSINAISNKLNQNSQSDLLLNYEKEFTAIEKLVNLADELSSTTLNLENISTLKLSNQMTVGQYLDDETIAESYLVGDCGIVVINDVFEGYMQDNQTYIDIINEINENFTVVKSKIRCYQNNNLTATDNVYTYTQVIDAFGDIYKSINGVSTKIVGNTTFTLQLAQKYESELESFQDNILVSLNGTRQIAVYILNEIKQIVLNEKNNYTQAYVKEGLQKVADYVDNCANYFNRSGNSSDALAVNLQDKEYYGNKPACNQLFAYSVGANFNNVVYFTSDFNTAKANDCWACVSNSFSYIFQMLETAKNLAV